MREMVQVVEESASILVVDDNPLIVNVLRSLLGSQHYEVLCSNNGKEALEILSCKKVDVIFCDVMMPELDGYGLHARVREHSEYGHIPFVFLTALDSVDEQKEGKSTGADDYVVKPFDPAALLAVVKGKVARSKGLKKLSEQRYDSYRKRVIHTLSHEFRTPLVAINTGAELLLEQENSLDKPKVQNLLQAIQRGGMRLEKLVNDFMLLQQIEAGVAERLFNSRHGLKDVTSILLTFKEIQKDEIAAHGFTVQWVQHCEGIRADIYEPHILDILNRIFSNALKFHGGNRQIEVHAYPLGETVAIEIRDRGIGINVEKVREAIEAFGQIDRDVLEQQGGGLGLSIANRYATINGGKLEFERRADGGSIVRLILPAIRN